MTSPTLAKLLAHLEQCDACKDAHCAEAHKLAKAWTEAMTARMEPREAAVASTPLSPVEGCSCACCKDGREMVRCYGYASPHACMCDGCVDDEQCSCAFCQALLGKERN